MQRAPAVQLQQIDEVRRTNQQLIRQRAPHNLFQHEQHCFILRRQPQGDVARDLRHGHDCAGHQQPQPHRYLAAGRGLAPALRQFQTHRAIDRSDRAAGRAFDKLRGGLPQPLRVAFFLQPFALAVRVMMPRQQRQPQRNHMGTHHAPLHVVTARTLVFAGMVRQNPRPRLDGAAAPRNRALNSLILPHRGIHHEAPLEQRTPIPEGGGPTPVLQHLDGQRQLHEPLSAFSGQPDKRSRLPRGHPPFQQ